MKHLSSPVRPLQICLTSLIFLFSSVAISGTKVAFIGDQGTNGGARAVLKMIANEGTDLVLIQGDLGYDIGVADRWEANLNEALGENFPVLSVVGNHENHEWGNYHRYIKQRIDRAGGLNCSGNPGVKALCQFDNLEIVQVSPGIREIEGVNGSDNYAQYISDAFSADSDKWRICTWHKNMSAYQTGSKSNTTGWDVYRACLDVGAMVAVAHEHAYSRTHLMDDYESLSVAHFNSDMTLEPGKSFMFVSGLGGRSIREQTKYGDWWASVYTATQGATHGALFCDFESNTAECYFKAINGAVPDRFTLRLKSGASNNNNNNNSQQNDNPQPVAANLPAVFERTDRDEVRWIDYDANGNVGNVWIDRSCADIQGGVDVRGNWDDLVALAPSMDSITNPCTSDSGNAAVSNNPVSISGGYVFRRNDKNEYRWIDKNDNGQIGSVRIDDNCAASLGGARVSGSWSELNAAAPALDQLANPCLDNAPVAGNTQSTTPESVNEAGYVFARTDKDESRWIAKNSSGEFGSVRINKVCADNLGGAYTSGDWFQLMERAPNLDAIANPCGDNDLPNWSQSALPPPPPPSAVQSNVAGYIFERTDKREFRWVARNDNGNMGNVWIEESCAQQLGLPIVRGDWERLENEAPAFDSLRNPCAN